MKLSKLNITVLKQHKANFSMLEIDPEPEVFTHGLIIDMQSINLLCTIYDNLTNKEKFDTIFSCPFKTANLLNKMWSFVK